MSTDSAKIPEAKKAPFDFLRLRTALIVALIFYAVFCYQHDFFYKYGGYLTDAGIHTFFFYKNGVNPHWPPSVDSQGFGNLLYTYHTSFVIGLLSLASYLTPLGRIDWFSFCQAGCYALIAYAVCSLVDLYLGGKKSVGWVIASAALAFVYILNGFTLSLLGYPHFESVAVATGLCFLASLLRGRTKAAGIWFFLACISREDIGFHLTAILAVLWVASYLQPHLTVLRRRFLLFACVGFGASVLLILLQRIFFPHPVTSASPLQSAFFGKDGAHFTWQIIGEHFTAFRKTTLSLLVAVGASLLCSVITRKYVLLLCWVAYFPWFLLNFLSIDPSRQALGIYHVFPFIFAAVWPLMVLEPISVIASAKSLAVVFLLGISSTVGQRIAQPEMFNILFARLAKFHLQSEGNLNTLGDSLHNEPQLYGNVGLDEPAMSLYLETLRASHWDHKRQKYDTLVFFKGTMFTDTMIHLAVRDGLGHAYEVAGTHALVVSNREIPTASNGKTLLKPTSLWLPLSHFMPGDAIRLPDGSLAQSSVKVCILAFGPYVALPAGKYRVTYYIDKMQRPPGAPNFVAEPVAKVSVSHGGNSIETAVAELKASDLPATTSLTFEVTPEQKNELFEFSVIALGRDRIVVKKINLEKL